MQINVFFKFDYYVVAGTCVFVMNIISNAKVKKIDNTIESNTFNKYLDVLIVTCTELYFFFIIKP